jgi:hypothetical protein
VAAVLSIGVRIPQETVIERMSGSNPVLTTKNRIMKIMIEIHLTEWHLIPFKTALGFTWLCFDVHKF